MSGQIAVVNGGSRAIDAAAPVVVAHLRYRIGSIFAKDGGRPLR